MKLMDRLRGMMNFDIDEGKINVKKSYEFPFKSPEMMTQYDFQNNPPQSPTEEMKDWLEQCNGSWNYIWELGTLWGVGFYDESDAMAFKLRWL